MKLIKFELNETRFQHICNWRKGINLENLLADNFDGCLTIVPYLCSLGCPIAVASLFYFLYLQQKLHLFVAASCTQIEQLSALLLYEFCGYDPILCQHMAVQG